MRAKESERKREKYVCVSRLYVSECMCVCLSERVSVCLRTNVFQPVYVVLQQCVFACVCVWRGGCVGSYCAGSSVLQVLRGALHPPFLGGLREGLFDNACIIDAG